MENGNKPINPTPIAGGDKSVVSAHDANNVNTFDAGLTKREYFAAMAMQGLVSNSKAINEPSTIANRAIKYADELLKIL